MSVIPPQLIGQSPAWLATLDQISGAAALDRSMLVIGERGTGKELAAARLPFLSPRWEKAYIALNCAALSEDLLDSELFGHEAGAFTGASKRRAGRFERANGGTLFLDEIAAASPRVQEKLLRVIEYGEMERLGGEQTIKVDVRVIGAANVDLPKAAEEGKFRADLLDRLAFDVITLPPLRMRRSDIAVLAEHFAKRMTAELGAESFPGFSKDVLSFMQSYDWPGNVRELKNAAERAVGRAFNEEGGLSAPISQMEIDPFASPWRLGADTSQAPQAPAKEALPMPKVDAFTKQVHTFELAIITKALAESDGHQGRAAKALDMTYHQFRGMLRKHGLKK